MLSDIPLYLDVTKSFIIDPCVDLINPLRHEDIKKGKTPQKGIQYNKWTNGVIPYYIDTSVFCKYLYWTWYDRDGTQQNEIKFRVDSRLALNW